MIIAAKPILNSAIRQVTHARSPVFARTSQPVATFSANPPANWNPFVWLFDKIQKVFEIFAKTSLGQLLGKGLKKINHLLQAPKKEPAKSIISPPTPPSPPPTKPLSSPEPIPSAPLEKEGVKIPEKISSQPQKTESKPNASKSKPQPHSSQSANKLALNVHEQHKTVVFNTPELAALNQKQRRQIFAKKNEAFKYFNAQVKHHKAQLNHLKKSQRLITQTTLRYVQKQEANQQKLMRTIQSLPASHKNLELPSQNELRLKASKLNISQSRPLYQKLWKETRSRAEITETWYQNFNDLKQEADLQKSKIATFETYLKKIREDYRKMRLEHEKLATLEDIFHR